MKYIQRAILTIILIMAFIVAGTFSATLYYVKQNRQVSAHISVEKTDNLLSNNIHVLNDNQYTSLNTFLSLKK